jgi:dynamin 1-like protein
MEQLIPIVNKLQDVFGAIGQESLDLPQITVVGSQSAGKSSVLENIVGRDFLPRGIGIVTRRPLVLQLYAINPHEHSSEEKSRGEEWGEFLHLPGQKFYDFNQIRDEIVRETDRITGRNKGISNKTINLKIFSPYVLNLTLVDLPGITKVPTGDQPEDVEEQIRNMCFEFISNPNAIILAVTAANQDLANSDGLKMARAVDPEGERTIGVLTKVDIMDHGTDCCDILNNKVIPLRRGYIAVINRSQKDIAENLSIRKGLAKEQAYFQAHPKYRNNLARCGTRNLAKSLNTMLMHHIRDCLPDIKTRISKMLINVQNNLDSLGEGVEDQSSNAKGVVLLRILSQFAANFNNKVDGKGSNELFSEMTELYGGARIAYIFNEMFGKKLKSLDPFEGLEDEDIRTAIANANGTRPALFVPEISFDLLVRRQIARLEQPGLQCLDMVVEEMQKMIHQSESVELNRFPELRDRAMEVVTQLLRACVAPASKMISNLIQIELAYINTSHPDFIGGKAAALAAGRAKPSANSAAPSGERSLVPVGAGGGNGNATQEGYVHPNPLGMTPGGGQSGMTPVTPQGGGNGAGDGGAANRGAGGFWGVFQSPANAGGGPNRPQVPAGIPAMPPRGGGHPNNQLASPPVDDYHGIRLGHVPEKMRCNAVPTERERTETEIIKTLIRSYFDIVKKNFMDLVPKTIMRFLVITFKEGLQNELVCQLYKENVMNELMRETEEVASKRRAFREMRDLLHRANEIVNEVRDFQPANT